MNCLLDTHTFLWAAMDPEKLSRRNSTPCRTSTYRTVKLGTGVSRRCGMVSRATSTPASNPNK